MKLILSVILLFSAVLFAEEYHVNTSAENEVKFISDAPIGDFEGVTDDIDGYLYYEDGDLTKNSKLYFEVELNTLDTGIGLRNRHMRDNYLHTDKYPLTYFKGKIVKAEKTSENEYKVTAYGDIFIHGVKNPMKVDGTMTKNGDQYNIKTQFIVKLSDFNIEIPSIMFYKIDENMDLQLNFFVKLYKGDQ